MKNLFTVRRASNLCPSMVALVAGCFLGLSQPDAQASLNAYDAAIAADASAGVPFVARMTNAVVLTGANRGAFNFGNSSGDVTIEFVLEGNPSAGSGSAYLAVGANATSNLRYEQFSNTGQLGFTQLGVLDYLFAPATPSPVSPTHIAYVWDAASLTMAVYLNGSVAGTRSGVTPGFAMPNGNGWLGGNPGGSELMTGTIYRVTVYDEILPADSLQRHADAFNDVVRLPIIVSFGATPTAIFTPGTTTLAWNVRRSDVLFLNGVNVTGTTNLMVSPTTNATYTLVASNVAGSVSRTVTVLVNPPPVLHSFVADRTFVAAGETTWLRWNASYGTTFTLSGTGDVTALTTNGIGAMAVQAQASGAITLTAANGFGTSTAAVHLQVVQPASHLVISEFMADDESISADEDGDFSGWIEVHNPTTAAINLAGHFLTDDEANPTKWAFPSRVLAPGGYLVVFASGKDRTNGAPLHANFSLSNDGEYLALVGPGPVLLHAFAPAYPPQRENVSFGILAGALDLTRFMGIPTPGAVNNETLPPPGAVDFSVGDRFFSNSFAVTLSVPEPGATILFTRDGSNPSATNGTVYSTPLLITNTTRIRAVSLLSNRTSRTTGANYVRLAPELAGYTSSLPILVIENFGAGTIPQKGWSGTGAGIKQVPRQSAVWATFDRSGEVSALTNAPQMFSDIAIRGRGAFSSTWRQKPYSVEAVDAAGEELKVAPLEMPEHADWVLYFPDPDDNKDPTLLFNTFAYELSRQTGHYSVRFRWVEAFVNEDGGDLQLADRRGVYAIVEKVSRGAERLDFEKLSEDGTSGSWLLNINRMDPEPEDGWPSQNGAIEPWFFHTAGPNRILQTPPNASVVGDDEPQQSNGFLNFDNPSGYNINTNQRAAIESWFKQFEDVLWNNAIWRDPVNGYRKYLDADDFADYFVLNTLTRNGDGLLISMFPWKGNDGRLRMGPAWDYNWSAYFISGAPTGTLLHRPDRLWYRRLFADPDFLQLYIDRWWNMRRGAMSNAGMDAIIDAQMNDITPEKAVLNGFASGAAWTNRLGQMKTWLNDRANWIDGNYLRPPVFNVNGGTVPDGFQLAIYGTNGAVYFTLDGTDPRAPGGAVATTAQAFQLPVALFSQTPVNARVRNGTNWSGLTTAVFSPPQDFTRLALTEIMYNPPAFGQWAGDELEFIELKNTGPNGLQLGTLVFSGISFTFTNGTMLAPGAFFVLARNANAFANRYPGVPVNGVFTGRLDNNGETLRLATAAGTTVLAVTYNDRAPWPLAADGHGFSAVPLNAATPGNSDDGLRWRGSTNPGGSPGADDPVSAIVPIRINEILAHTDLPQVDAIELFNPSAVTANVGGWFLSDDGSVPKKFRIADGTTIPPGGYLVLTEADFNPTPGNLFNFSLSSGGDSVYLSSGNVATNLSGYSHGVSFGASANGVSFGRYLNSVGEELFPAQLSITLGTVNAGPSVGPVVLSEIHYHPDSGGDEFVELRNVTAQPVPFFDPAHPTNTWQLSGLGFTFPRNVVLPSNSVVLIVSTNPADFRLKYSVPETVLILGPFAGALQDSGERLELQRPDAPDTNGVAYITVDEVRYNDRAPWPAGADGGGPSLQRRVISAYGNDPANWEAARPTPGADFIPGPVPSITIQPESRTVVAYHDVTFAVGTTEVQPLFFQWLFNGDPISGATNATLLLTNAQPGQAGSYRAVAYNSAGSAISAVAELTVLIPAVIHQQPQSIATNAGRTVTFSVSALGTGPLSYQWRFNGTNLLHATNASLSLTNIQSRDEGFYTVVIVDNVGDITSAPARLQILFEPFIIQHPVSQVVATGATVTISVAVTNNATLPIGYRIRRNGVTLPETFITLNERSAFFTVTNIRAPLTNYSIIVTNAGRPAGIASSAALITLLPDLDGDGLPDVWEAQHGFNTNSAADALVDSDNDRMLNWEEWIAGTDPVDAGSYLRFESITAEGGARLNFPTVAGRTYLVEFTDALGVGSWGALTSVVARASNRMESVVDLGYHTNRAYRLVTPARR